MDKTNRKNVTIRLDPSIAESIKIQAIKEGRSVSDIIEDLLRKYLDNK